MVCALHPMRGTSPITLVTGFFQKRQARFRTDVLVLLIFFGAALFQCLGRFPLVEPDEGRYAEIPREMLERGDFVTPRLNYVKYFEKPPLYYWMNCLSFRLFGQSEFAARFFSALSALLCIILTYQIGRAICGRREGLMAAVILGTSMGYFIQGRLNTTDMTLCLFMTASLGFFLLASQQDPRRSALPLYLSSACAAFAVLTKGPVGVILPAVAIALYVMPRRRRIRPGAMPLASAIALFILLSVPWFILVSIRNPEFPGFFFLAMNMRRFITPNEHVQPLLFFGPVLILFMFPWSLFFPVAARRFRNGRGEAGAAARSFLWIWMLVILCFFSLSRSKLVTYILPAFPAAALIIGQALSDACDGDFRLVSRQALAACLILIIGAIGIALYPFLAAGPRLAPPHCAAVGAILLAGGLLCLAAVRRGDMLRSFIALCATSYVMGIAVSGGPLRMLASKKSETELALLVKERAPSEALVASYGWYVQGLPFYAQRRVVVVGKRGELEFGSRREDTSAWFIDYAQLFRLWDSGRPIFLLIKKRDMPLFVKSVKTPLRVLGREGKTLLITNQRRSAERDMRGARGIARS